MRVLQTVRRLQTKRLSSGITSFRKVLQYNFIIRVMEPKSYQVYDSKTLTKLLEGLEVSPFMKLKLTSPDPIIVTDDIPIALADLNVAETLFCSFCNIGFTDQQQQRQHYKLDWHRYNLKLHLAQRKPISEEKFIQLADDVSSISGSDSESDEESPSEKTSNNCVEEDNRLSHLISRRSRILFNNSTGNVISLNRCLLLSKKEEPESYDYLIDLVKNLPNKSTWLIVMLGGGHFAAAIFKDGEPIVHKTFHSYTVRSKQGGSQSTKDGKGTHAKSAGSSMRRYNEQSLTQNIQDVLKTWGPEINKCDYIFYRALGRFNTSILFSGSSSPFVRADPRVRTIPFSTRRPTFNELKRVYDLIATVFVYDSNEMFKSTFSPPKPVKEIQEEVKKPSSPKRIDRAKERRSPDRQLPQIVQDLAAESSTDDTGSIELQEFTQEISFAERLDEFGDSLNNDKSQTNNRNSVKTKPKKKKKEKKPEKDNLSPEVRQFWTKLHGSCETNDSELLKQTLESYGETISKEELSMVLNQKNIEGQTVLHKMAVESKGDIIRFLMLHGCDPCIKDKKSQTPYDLCTEKTTRNIFRRFMGEFPDMYDYSKSHIPSVINEAIEAEIQEKKRALRKAKRQKDKEKKQQQDAAKYEEDEKKRYLALSDREKRALAAERRLIAASGKTAVMISRCFLCASDITGKVPFEYDSNRFCTITCLKAHRTGSKKTL